MAFTLKSLRVSICSNYQALLGLLTSVTEVVCILSHMYQRESIGEPQLLQFDVNSQMMWSHNIVGLFLDVEIIHL